MIRLASLLHNKILKKIESKTTWGRLELKELIREAWMEILEEYAKELESESSVPRREEHPAGSKIVS